MPRNPKPSRARRIVKVQRPLGGEMGDLLVYEKGRINAMLIECDSELGRFLLQELGTAPKRYFTVNVAGDSWLPTRERPW